VHVAVIPAQDRAELALRLGVLCCFVGHGVQALAMRPDWQPFLFGLPLGWMIVVGALDVLMGILAFATRSRAVLAWCAAWGLFTALLRPLVGLSFVEVLVRAGNYGPALALLAGRRARVVVVAALAVGVAGLALAGGPSTWHAHPIIELVERAGGLSLVFALVLLKRRSPGAKKRRRPRLARPSRHVL
jgi:hypothetical protein